MTNKEPIIIDGIDVSGCVFLDIVNGRILCNCCNSSPIGESLCPSIYCLENPNCYYKQLARKTQEYEKLKSQVDEDYNYYTTELKTLRDIISNKEKRNAALYLTSGRYRKALEEIEELANCGKDMYIERGKYPDYEAMAEWMKNQFVFILDIISKAKGSTDA